MSATHPPFPNPPASSVPEDVPNGHVALAVIQVDYTEHRRPNDDVVPIVHLFCREPDGTPREVRVTDYTPYFYADADEVNAEELTADPKVVDVEDAPEHIRGHEMVKINVQLPKHVAYLRDDFEITGEDDVLFPDRFLIDTDTRSGIIVPDRGHPTNVTVDELQPAEVTATPRVCTCDIEVDDRRGFPEDGEEPIISITLHDSYTDEYTVLVYLPDARRRLGGDDCPLETTDFGRGRFVRFAPSTPEPTVPVADGGVASSGDVSDDMESGPDGTAPAAGDDSRCKSAVASAPTPFEDYEQIGEDTPRTTVLAVESEVEMLEAFVGYLDTADPDVVQGWNFCGRNGFDAPYIVDRFEQLTQTKSDCDLHADDLSRIGETDTRYDIEPKGRIILDEKRAYERTQFSKKESYRLDYIGELELGVGKEDHDGDVGDLWVEDVARLVEYNLRDVELCVELNRQEELIDFWDEVRRFVGCRLGDAPTPSDVVDSYVLHELNGEYVLPSKGDAESEEYEGGAVFDASSGTMEWVNTLDLASLYPMCMITINASPETKIENPEAHDGETYCAPNGVHFAKTPDGVIRQIVNDLLAEREQKKALRDEHEPGTTEFERYDRQQAALKVIMNSLYGTLAWEKFRLYDKDIGAAVTATGRAVIDHTGEVARENGYEVIYGDTDSVFLQVNPDEINTVELTQRFIDHHEDYDLVGADGDPCVSDALRQKFPDMDEADLERFVRVLAKTYELEERINNSYNDFARENFNAEEHRLLIEAEKLYRQFFQAGKKKRYAGHILWKEGKFPDDTSITGFETIRSSVARFTRRVQAEMLDMIVSGTDEDVIREFLNDEIEAYLSGEVSLTEMARPKGINKGLYDYASASPTVRGARYANVVLGTDLGKGDKPKLLYIGGVDRSFFDEFEAEHFGGGGVDLTAREREAYAEFKAEQDAIACVDPERIPETFNVDYEKMLEKTFKGAIDRILGPMGIDFAEVRDGQVQQGLGEFM